MVVLRPLNVDEFLVLLLVYLPARDGKVLHVLEGLPQRLHRLRRYLDHDAVWTQERSLVIVLERPNAEEKSKETSESC